MTITVSSSNGEAPADALSSLPGRNGDGTPHTAPHVTAESYARIRTAMQRAGLGDLIPTDGWSCYRDLAAQQHMRDIGLTTIPVGQSIHGEWTNGSAVDLSNLGGFGAPRHDWLRDHGGEYGWYQPSWAQASGSLPEPWHWEYDQRGDHHAGEQPEPEPEPIEVPEDDTMQLVRIVEDGRIMALGTYQWAQVPTMDDYNAQAQVWGAYVDVTIGNAQRLNDQVNRNIMDLAHSMKAQGVGTSTQDAGAYRVAVLALILALAVLVGIVVALRNDELSGVWAGSGILLGGLLVWALAEVTRRRGRHTA